MLNGVSKGDRIARTLNGIKNQIEDFFFIVEDYVEKLDEHELRGLYELEEDIKEIK